MLHPTGISSSLPVLVGINTGDETQLVLAPRIGMHSLSEESDHTLLYYAGFSVGFFFEATEEHTVIPEVSITYPFGASRFDTSPPPARPDESTSRQLLFQIGFAVLYDT